MKEILEIKFYEIIFENCLKKRKIAKNSKWTRLNFPDFSSFLKFFSNSIKQSNAKINFNDVNFEHLILKHFNPIESEFRRNKRKMAINQKVTGSGEPTGKAGRAFEKVAPSFRIKKEAASADQKKRFHKKKWSAAPERRRHRRREKKKEEEGKINVEVSAAIVRRMNKSLMKPFSAHFSWI